MAEVVFRWKHRREWLPTPLFLSPDSQSYLGAHGGCLIYLSASEYSSHSCLLTMYIRPVHAELDVPTLQAFIQQYPLGLLTTSIPRPNHATLQTTHIPFVIDIPEDSSDGHESESAAGLGVLRGHIARANPQYKSMVASLQQAPSPADTDAPSSTSASLVKYLFGSSAPVTPQRKTSDPLELEEDVLVLFNLPSHSYLTPKFYISTKPSTGRVVPTWDYAAVQVYGRLRLHHANTDETSAFLQKQVEDLTNQRECAHSEASGSSAAPWRVDESPVDYVEALKRGIAGLEIRIERIEGRFKLSQEATDGDWRGVVEGFRALGTHDGNVLADLIEERGKHRDKVESGAAVASTAENEKAEQQHQGEKPPVA